MNEVRSYDQSVKASDYQEGLIRAGLKCYRGPSNDLWMTHEMGSMVRLPTFQLRPPTPDEFRNLFWKLHVPAISYNLEPDENHEPNAWLYVCEKGRYSPEKLIGPARRNIRHAQRNLRFEIVDWDTLLEHGAEVYCDTRTRIGLSDGTLEGFRSHFSMLSRIAGCYIAGAWHGDTMVAFMTLIAVENWVEIQGSFSATQYMSLCPNDGLFAFVFDHYLIQGHLDIVHAGLSSLQQETGAAGLHRFKQKVGFQAKPVHRAFAVHPLVRPLVNPLSLAAFETLQKIAPKNRKIRKATGMLDILVNKKGLLDRNEKTSDNTSTIDPKID
jgi:hypothetical protein